MKTGYEILKDIQNILISKEVKQKIGLTGDIKLYSRIVGSDLEDIVLNTVYSNNNQIQSSKVNVNIYTPNLRSQETAFPPLVDNLQPNCQRADLITKTVIAMLDGYRGFDFFINLENAAEYIDFEGKSFLNIQFAYTRKNSANSGLFPEIISVKSNNIPELAKMVRDI